MSGVRVRDLPDFRGREYLIELEESDEGRKLLDSMGHCFEGDSFFVALLAGVVEGQQREIEVLKQRIEAFEQRVGDGDQND